MASDRLVRYIVTVNADGALVGMERIRRETDRTASSMERAGGRMKAAGAGMVSFGRSLSQVALPVAAIGGYAVKSAIQFEASMTRVQTQAGASASEVKKFGNEILKLKNVAFAPNELADALYYIRSDGFKAAEAMKILQASTEGAAISGASLKETAYGLTSVLRTAPKDVHGPADAMNKLNSIVGLGKLKWEDLNQALSTGFLFTVNQAHLGLNDVGTAIDAFARGGKPAVNTATNLQKALIQMMTVVGIRKKDFAKIGLGPSDLAKDLNKPHGLIVALEDLQNHLKKLDPYKGKALLGQAFGASKGAGTIYGLLELLPQQKIIEKEREHYGTLQQAMAKTEATNQYKVKIAIIEVKKALIELGKALIPVVIPAFKKLATFVKDAAEWFSKLPKPIKEVGTYLAIAAVLGGPIFILFGNLLKIFGSLFRIIPGLTRLFPALGAATGVGADAASGGIAALLPEIAALLAAAAAVYAMYKLIKAIKDFLTPGSGTAKTHGAKALKLLQKHEPSDASAHVQGALAMLGGGPSHLNAGALGMGSAAEAQYLKEHPGYGLGAAGGKAAQSRYSAAEYEKAIKERNEFIVHTHLHLSGKQIAEATATFLRDNPSSKAAKHHTEAVLRKSFINNARSANP